MSFENHKDNTDNNVKNDSNKHTFYYFGFGSNMLKKRIHIKNPSAVQKSIGVLKDHRLDFANYSKFWHGSAATIIPEEGSEVMGVIWELDNCHLDSLDQQESVAEGMYFPKHVNVITPGGQSIECRVYQMVENPKDKFDPENLPQDRRPSLIYMKVLIAGAKEHNFPDSYVQFLRRFAHNDYDQGFQIEDSK